MKHELIVLTGRKGSGKSTLAAELEKIGYKRIRFATPLKDMLRAIGLTEEQIEGELKEVPCALLGGKTPRYAMETLGTEWGRDMIGSEFWIRLWAHRVAAHNGPVVVEDCRFENEAAAARALGGVVYRIVSGDTPEDPNAHASEKGVLAEVVVENKKVHPSFLLVDFLHARQEFISGR